MRSTLLLFCAVVAVVATRSADAADVSYAHDLTQLTEQRDKAIDDAVEPINRRYRTSLEQLLRKATQGNDLKTAVKIQHLLGALSPKSVTISPVIGTWTLRQGNSAVPRVFKEDGVCLHESGRILHWTIDGKSLKLNYGDDHTDVFEWPGENGVLKGISWNGKKITLERAK